LDCNFRCFSPKTFEQINRFYEILQEFHAYGDDHAFEFLNYPPSPPEYAGRAMVATVASFNAAP
jgi:hypothetical protein